MKALILIFMGLSCLQASAQHSLKLRLIPTFASEKLVLEQRIQHPSSTDSLQIDVLRLYLSKFELYAGEKRVFAEENSYHLVDMDELESLSWQMEIPTNISFTHIQFELGIDSATNISGVMGGDLDPMHGMYWAWQSGYINFKLEGKSDVCPARKQKFQFHIGGYQAPFESIQTVRLAIEGDSNIQIELAIDQLLQQVDLSKEYQIMSPNAKSVHMASYFPSLFSIIP